MARQPSGLLTMDTTTKATRELHVPGVSRGHEDRPEAGADSQVDAGLQDRSGRAPCCWLVCLAPADKALLGVDLHGCWRACRHTNILMLVALFASARDIGHAQVLDPDV